MMKRFARLCFAFFIVLCCLSVFSVLATDKDESVEVVLLFDVSGSMKTSDPLNDANTRLSIEAAHQLVFNYPTEQSFYISVVLYNSDVYAKLEKVDVSTNAGINNFVDQMRRVLNDNAAGSASDDSLVPGITCWNGGTNIGGALEAAEKILNDSTIKGKKAVILFTDGKIDLSTSKLEQESTQKAINSTKNMQSKGITIYSVGLNIDGGVDRTFLKSLSGEQNTKIVSSASDLSGVFNELYTLLFDNSHLDASEEEFVVKPNVETKRNIRIYGQAVKEANISLSSGAKLNTIKVTTPGGVTVAELDLKNPSSSKVNNDYCVINVSGSLSSATIKIVSPIDGDWVISVTGEESTVITRKIYLFDLLVKNTANTDKVFVGDTYTYNADIYNSESNVHITSPALYNGEDKASAILEVKNNDTKEIALYNGKLNSAKNGFVFDFKMERAGTYTLKTVISHSQFEIESESMVTVVGPTINSKTNNVGNDIVKVTIQIINPLTSKKVNSLPGSINLANMAITVKMDGKVIDTVNITKSQFTDGEFTYEKECTNVGEYSFNVTGEIDGKAYKGEEFKYSKKASIISVNNVENEFTGSGFKVEFSKDIDLKTVFSDSDGDKLTYELDVPESTTLDAKIENDVLRIKAIAFGETVISVRAYDGKGAQNEYSFKVNYVEKESIISVNKGVENNFTGSGFKVDFSKEINLDSVFSDNDGDKLSYELIVPEKSTVEAKIENNLLTITGTDFGKTTITVRAYDGKGVENKQTFTLEYKSTATTLIIIGIIVLILIVVAVIVLLILNKKKTINMAFKVRVEYVDDEFGREEFAVFNIARLASKKTAKPKMSLYQILTINGLASFEYGSMGDEESAKSFVYGQSTALSNIVMTGHPFKKRINITNTTISGKKKDVRKYVFSNGGIAVRANRTLSVMIGKHTDEL